MDEVTVTDADREAADAYLTSFAADLERCQGTPPSPTGGAEIVERLRKALAVFTREGERALPWEVWNSCSFRRVKTAMTADRHGGEDVLSAYNQRGDNHPDLSMPEAELFALVEAVNLLPDLATHIATQEAELTRLRQRVAEAREIIAELSETAADFTEVDQAATERARQWLVTHQPNGDGAS